MRRVVVPELLDTDAGTPDEVAASLADLRWLNRWFGGVSTTVSLLRHAAQKIGKDRLTFLDVAGASGDGALTAKLRLADDGIRLDVTCLDRAPSHLPSAKNGHGPQVVAGDALQLPFADNSFDLVGSSLFLHHLEPPEVKSFMMGSLRVCRHAVIVNDLRRSRLHWLSAVAGQALYRSRLTRHDAPVSVRRAYTISELRQLLETCGPRRLDLSQHYFFRTGIVAWKR